ncbi:hypothetical protein [Pedobacter aquatilis]|uniref:hypothetical protein n=1 Tax=Pedobacter aquatilis TaxID=351343 RepID=UPI0029312D33|nr:hypothetical protein [Pedobacter aquatilis]
MKYLKIILFCFFIATAISLAGVFLLQSIGLIGSADTDFKNLPYGIAVGVNLFLFLGTFTIFLNLKKSVRDNPLWSLLSFFLLPGLFILFALLAMWDEPWPGVLFCVPYLLMLGFFFLRYRKEVEQQSI